MAEVKICVVGLGYVGLPLVLAFAEKYSVVGFDVCNDRVTQLREGNDVTKEVSEKSIIEAPNSIQFTDRISEIAVCNFYIVTVPTPIDDANQPVLDPLKVASKMVGSVLKQGDIVVYESTVYPGVTEDVCVPLLEAESGLIFNIDFFCGYSPERINPGDKKRTIKKILKVTSGSTPEVANYVNSVYGSVIEAGTYLAPSIKVAEAAKVIENIQRDVNIALINELSIIFGRMDIDTHEVLDAASTKWNFINMRPGLVGGHCIGVDPYYLTYKAAQVGHESDLILTARNINNSMASYVAANTIKHILKGGKSVTGARVLVMGFAFKENCTDIRNTKVSQIIADLHSNGLVVDVFDPWVDFTDCEDLSHCEIIRDPLQSKNKYDAIIVAVAHDAFKAYTARDYEEMSNGEKIVIDVKNIVAAPTWRL